MAANTQSSVTERHPDSEFPNQTAGRRAHWPLVFCLTPSDASFETRTPAPTVIDHQIDIAAPPSEVYRALVGMRDAEKWVQYFCHCEWQNPDAPVAKREFIETFTFMSLQIRNLVADEGARWIASIDRASIPLANWMLEDASFTALPDGGTHFRWRIFFEPPALLRPFAGLVVPFFDKMFATDTSHLKAFCEAGGGKP